MKKLLSLAVAMLLAACSVPETPAQSIYLVQSQYATALKAELAYSNLPRCGADAPTICSKASVIRKLQHADDLAWIAIKEAQAAVRTKGYGDSTVTTAVASAKALVSSFVKITQNLKKE